MRPLLFIAASYVFINLAVCAVVGGAFGMPRRAPPVDLFDPDGRVMERLRSRSVSRRLLQPEAIRVLVDNEAMEMLVESTVLARAATPQLLFLGASSAAGGCRPTLLQPLLPEYQSSNFGIGGANVTVMQQTLDEILQQLPPEIRSRSAVVLFMSYMSFLPDAVRWHRSAAAVGNPSRPLTCVDVAMQRCPMILDGADPVGRRLPAALIRAAKERFRIWRLLTAEWGTHPGDAVAQPSFWKLQTPKWREARLQREGAGGPRPKSFIEMTVEEQVAEIDRGMAAPGVEFDRDQCEKLVGLVRHATGAGMQVVIMDPPLPSRHRRAAPRLEPFKRQIAELMAPFVEAGSVAVVDLTDSLGDEHFADLAHPSPESLEIWATLLADNLRGLLRPQSPRIRE